MTTKQPKHDLDASGRETLLETLEARFEENPARHEGIAWADVRARLEADGGKLSSLAAMERTGGEPDVVGHDRETDEYLFVELWTEFHAFNDMEASPARPALKKGETMIMTNFILYNLEGGKMKRIRIAHWRNHPSEEAKYKG